MTRKSDYYWAQGCFTLSNTITLKKLGYRGHFGFIRRVQDGSFWAQAELEIRNNFKTQHEAQRWVVNMVMKSEDILHGRESSKLDELEVLRVLASLEDKGLISQSSEGLVSKGYDEGSLVVDLPSVVTYEGRLLLEKSNNDAKT